MLTADERDQVNRIWAQHMTQPQAEPSEASLGTQLARGLGSGASLGFWEPYKGQGEGGLPETLASFAGASLPFALSLLGGGAGVAALAARSPALAARLIMAGRTAGEVVPGMMGKGLLMGYAPSVLTRTGGAAAYGLASAADAIARGYAEGKKPSEVVSGAGFPAALGIGAGALTGGKAGRFAPGILKEMLARGEGAAGGVGGAMAPRAAQEIQQTLQAAKAAGVQGPNVRPTISLPLSMEPAGKIGADIVPRIGEEAGYAGPFRFAPDVKDVSFPGPFRSPGPGMIPSFPETGGGLSEWIAKLSDQEVMGLLQKAGIPDVPSMDSARRILVEIFAQQRGPWVPSGRYGSAGEELTAAGGGRLTPPFAVKPISGASDLRPEDVMRIQPPQLRDGLVSIQNPKIGGHPIMDPAAAPPNKLQDMAWFGQLSAAWRELWGGAIQKLPSELGVLRQRPSSAAISEMERHNVALEAQARKILERPDMAFRYKYGVTDGETLEQQAVNLYRQAGQVPDALARGMQIFPEDVRSVLQLIRERLPIENQARDYMGLDPIPEVPGPFIPRLVKATGKDIEAPLRRFQGLGGNLTQTIRSFQMEREFETMLEGRANGVEYVDWRNAILRRLFASIELEETANLVKNLETKGVLFRTAEAAKKASPVGQAFEIGGVPGTTTQRWFTATDADRHFLVQNMTAPRPGMLFPQAMSWLNQLFRNPNLYNPLPHFDKNMLYKFALSGGDFNKLAPRMAEFLTTTKPILGAWEQGPESELIKRFKAVMPFTESGQTAQQLLQDALVSEGPASMAKKAIRFVGAVNRPSSKAIFAYLDPALRYARWTQYVEKGLSDQEAANHVWIDLVRYGVQSDATGFWKSVPLNFFVPWRMGTVTSLTKQLTEHPLRAAMVIGGIDYLREINYRHTGRWIHLPIDYVEGPIAQLLGAESGGEFARGLVGTTFGTLLFGPGGAFAGAQLVDAIKAAEGTPDWNRLKNMFWGTMMLFGGHEEWQKFTQTGDPWHLVNIMKTAMLGEHDALKYSPRRFSKFLPDWLPGMAKSQIVRDAETQLLDKQGRQIRLQADQLMARGDYAGGQQLLDRFNQRHGTQIGASLPAVARLTRRAELEQMAQLDPALQGALIRQRLMPGIPVEEKA